MVRAAAFRRRGRDEEANVNVARRTEAARVRVRAITDRLMRMTSVLPRGKRVGPTIGELADRERRDEAPLPAEPEAPLSDQQHPLAPRLERGHPKL